MKRTCILGLFLLICSLVLPGTWGQVAQGATLAEEAKRIDQRFGVRVNYRYDAHAFFPAGWLKPPIKAQGRPIPKEEAGRLLPLISRFMSRFPKDLVSANLKSIYLLGAMNLQGRYRNSTRYGKGIYLVSRGRDKGYTDNYIRQTLYSNFLAALMAKHKFPKAEWRGINPAGFKYLGGKALKQDKLSAQSQELLSQGFLTRHSRTYLINDISLLVQALLTRPEKIRNLASRYPRIKSKADLARGYLESLSPGFNFSKPGLVQAPAPKSPQGPLWMSPFGITLGRAFPAGLDYDRDNSRFDQGRERAVRSYLNIRVAASTPLAAGPGRLTRLNAFAAPVSSTVYRVSAILKYKNQGTALKDLDRKAGLLTRGIKHSLVHDWKGGIVYRSEEGWKVKVYDLNGSARHLLGRVRNGVYDPLGLTVMKNTSGNPAVRLVLASHRDGQGRLDLVHLPGLELRLAKTFEKIPGLVKLYAHSSKQDQPPFRVPFGVALGAPLLNSSRIREEAQGRIFTMNPPAPHDLFRIYTAGVTPLTGTTVQLSGHCPFKSDGMCMETLNNVAKSLARSYGVPKPKWHRQTDWNYLYTEFDLKGKQDRELFPVSVRMYCEPTKVVGEEKMRRLFGPKVPKKTWRGMILFEFRNFKDLQEMEECLMNPVGGPCY